MSFKFITFEGGEGSGKSTQAKLLFEAMIKAKIEAILTREPGGTKEAEEIRNLLLHKEFNFHPITEVLLHNACRYEHAKNLIIPALRDNKIVICDRFVDSTMAYQGYALKVGKKIPALMHNMLMEGLVPDVTFILDIDPEIGLRAAEKRSLEDNYEKRGLEFHQRVRNGFKEIASIAKDRCLVIDANRPIKIIHQEIINIINDANNTDIVPVV